MTERRSSELGLGNPEEKARQHALAFLLESGRVNTTEDAERYLASLNHIKEKLVRFVKEEFPTLLQSSKWRGVKPHVFLQKEILDERELASMSALAKADSQNLDLADPHIWDLQRIVTSHLEGVGCRQNLLIPMTKGPDISIQADISGLLALDLQAYLSGEEVEILTRENAFARKDLAKRLHEEAALVVNQDVPGWDRFFRKRDGASS
jgi:hypothetical protein